MKKNLISIDVFLTETRYQPNPTAIFNQICKKKSETLLLESAEINKKHHLESMMIIDAALKISFLNQIVIVEALTKNGVNLLSVFKSLLPKNVIILSDNNPLEIKFPILSMYLDEDQRLRSLSVFDAIRFLIKSVKNLSEFAPKSMFFGGLFSYDLITSFENLPILNTHQHCPDFCFYLSETLLILDHKNKTSIVQVTSFTNDNFEKKRLKDRLEILKNKLSKNLCPIKFDTLKNMKLWCNKTDEEYNKIIVNVKKFILQGEIFQVVPSRKFYLSCVNPLSSYEVLKKNNPSPYMFFMQDRKFTLFGASPESALKYDINSRQIEIYPIAGTRPRGRRSDGSLDLDLDNRIELEMRTNNKELAEHLMLVDLARNDLAKICEPGTRHVADLIRVDRYSHVMHLVSRVIGKLRFDLDFLHAYQACMNMGTLTGAPKVRAMELISEIEGEKRGSYGGAIGYFTGLGMLDTCIVIRSAYVENKIATIQAGAGIVLDSVPQLESDESKNKAKAVIQAIANSHSCQIEYL
ncbi:anthranilate synthase component I [Buchnera aphidicola str. Bp (Baizongia pistaciae)]|uniref:Anthranilate synthase component 1 n=1 Tax=Buchnera aphidicola subsp. Baizongia pistaciae (strain Bp) TaxID=224915 RepID=TRPE_BUCBP|nr:anthranilate synthase component 1 [Buchnera aphidicola]Q89A29.1 RecName: Full=Anthranilate synthase component 1; Short=AS; Short=ASI [Buchnera aphidicola str. Bp (Baizongia pistaciae)]AAO27228.1 anthranilate synthase component I [Buchnera aphidicola str. Bp (Baizongia pistaciae)]